jgi:hypothetical protein
MTLIPIPGPGKIIAKQLRNATLVRALGQNPQERSRVGAARIETFLCDVDMWREDIIRMCGRKKRK